MAALIYTILHCGGCRESAQRASRAMARRPQRRAGLDVAGPKQLMVLVHVPHSIELILSASVPCSAGEPRAVLRADADGVPSTPGRLGKSDWKRKAQLWETAGTTNTIKYYYCMRLAASFAGVSKPGQRSWIQGPVTKVFVGSNPIPRTTDIILGL